MKGRQGSPAVLFGSVLVLPVLPLAADQISVRYVEGRLHGFLALRDVDNTVLASGSLVQFASGNRVTAELTFHAAHSNTPWICQWIGRPVKSSSTPRTTARRKRSPNT